eukprot:CAMPEP_0119102882 /NCGR_PEP_ID=MMETSP1180-20130426/1483_1 /TAXON_ID=3052 ORGANISM="Chlamydomonas cf sp, Strain CCMP681" /NCGR_SAMPLE_ID=MMETSP1180 /ASSEMBLY_ACC=CAM_ASM_000741 /LENGTH=51 /DNA_ID=CAMNT_0007087259 /DNA_START=94 /DNA_END=249 /DNA_ORIENTATION=-
MAPKEEFKAKPNTKGEVNKPKGGNAKKEEQKAKKAAKNEKNGTTPSLLTKK